MASTPTGRNSTMHDTTLDSLDSVAARAAARFKQRFGKPPRWIVAAPGRVNLIGEHIDYNVGFVLPMAIDRYCVIAADDATTDEGASATLHSAINNDDVRINLRELRPHVKRGHWSNYVTGVIAGFAQVGAAPTGFRATIETSVPVGGGLSSSASLEVATATLLEVMLNRKLEPADKALLCQKAEHDFAGVPCGIMDQFASVFGREDHLMLLDCRSQHVEHIPLTDPNITVLIMNTNVKHELSEGEYAKRRAQCESATKKLGVSSLRDARFPQLQARRSNLDDVEFRRARHAISEIGRTVRAAEKIKEQDWAEIGQLMYASHKSLRDDYEISCHELDLLVELARGIGPSGGVIGSRMTGGGFGGCTVSLVESAKIDAVTTQLCARYKEQTGITATYLTSRPARGAHVLKAE